SAPSCSVVQVGRRMFCSTVNSGTRRRSSGMYPTPWPTRRCAGRPSRSTWPSSALPVAGIAPISARNNVGLPAPFPPVNPHISPPFNATQAPRMIGTGPIETLRFAPLSMGRLRLRNLGAADQRLHARIGKRDRRCAIGDHGAVVEGEHAIGEARNDLHV